MIGTFVIVSIITILFLQLWAKRRNLPPGPVPLPLIGNLHQIALASFSRDGIVGIFHKFKEEYGDIYTVWLGPLPTVNVCSLELAQESMVKQGNHFVDRWFPDIFDIARNGMGIIGTSGRLWTEQRRFALHTFRNFGLGRNLMEQRIMAEVDIRLGRIEGEMKEGVWVGNPRNFIEPMVGSVINRILFSVRFDEANEEEFFALKEEFEQGIEDLSLFDVLVKKSFFNAPLLKPHFDKLLEPVDKLKSFLANQVEERIHAIASGKHVIDSEPADYVDAFLSKMESEKKSSDSTFNRDVLVVNLLDLWAAGQETTSTTIQWAMLHLATRPDVAAEVHKELISVVPENQHLSLSHKPKTPKLVAVVTEVQRLASILNMNLWRECGEDVVVDKYSIPKGTIVTAQLSVIMSNSKFQNPDKFDPWRYLNDPDLEQHVIPFGLGKRACLGESLARAELYLILGNLMLNYEMTPAKEMPNLTQLKPFGVMKRPRQTVLRFRTIRKRVPAVF